MWCLNVRMWWSIGWDEEVVHFLRWDIFIWECCVPLGGMWSLNVRIRRSIGWDVKSQCENVVLHWLGYSFSMWECGDSSGGMWSLYLKMWWSNGSDVMSKCENVVVYWLGCTVSMWEYCVLLVATCNVVAQCENMLFHWLGCGVSMWKCGWTFDHSSFVVTWHLIGWECGDWLVGISTIVFARGLLLPVAVVWGTKYPRGAKC